MPQWIDINDAAAIRRKVSWQGGRGITEDVEDVLIVVVVVRGDVGMRRQAVVGMQQRILP